MQVNTCMSSSASAYVPRDCSPDVVCPWFRLAAAVDEPRGLDVGLELASQRAGLQRHHLRRQLEFLLDLNGYLPRHLGRIAAARDLDAQPQDVVAALVQRLGAEVADLELAEHEVL